MKTTKKEDDETIDRLLKDALSDPQTVKSLRGDFANTYQCAGLGRKASIDLAAAVLAIMGEGVSLDAREAAVNDLFKRTRVGDSDLRSAFRTKVAGRTKLIYEQVSPHLAGIDGLVVDYGCGNGDVADRLLKQGGFSMVGYDVVLYPAPGVTVTMYEFDGDNLFVHDGYFEAGLLTNVLHHEPDNERIIVELTRKVRRRLVIIETVPVGKTPEEIRRNRKRVFGNDWHYNRAIEYGAGIRVPATYERADSPDVPDPYSPGWPARFRKHGWRMKTSINLGIDQEAIADVHHLYVFER